MVQNPNHILEYLKLLSDLNLLQNQYLAFGTCIQTDLDTWLPGKEKT